MAEGDTDTALPTDPLSPEMRAQANAILKYLQPQQAPAPSSGQGRSIVGLLGQAAAGGGSGMTQLSDDQANAAGTHALMNFGTSLLAQSGWHQGKITPGQMVGAAMQNAQQGYIGDEAVAAAKQTAQQDYNQQQTGNRLQALGEVGKLQQLQLALRKLQIGASAANPLLGANTPPAGGTSLAQVGAADVPPEYLPFYKEASERTGIPIDVLIAKDKQESGFNPNAVGPGGAIGISQIQPGTAKAPGFGLAPVDPKALTDPRTAINFGADYLKARMPAGGNPTDPATINKGLTAYNGGGDPNYVANVSRYLPKPASPAPAQAQASAVPPATAPYQVASTGPVPPPTAPTPDAAPAATPPAAPVVPVTPAPGKMSFADFQARNPIPIDPAALTVLPQGLQNAQKAMDAAAQERSLALAGVGGDVDKATTNYREAAATLAKAQQDAQAKSLELQQKAQQHATDTQRQLYDAQMQREAAADEAQRQRVAAETLAENNNRREMQRTAETQRLTQQNKQIDLADTNATEAQKNLTQLALLKNLSDAAGPATIIPPEARDWAVKLGLTTDQQAGSFTAKAALDAAASAAIPMLRQQSGMQRLTDKDITLLERSSPGGSMDPQQFRDAKLAFLTTAMQRTRDYNNLLSKNIGSGMKVGEAMDQADRDAGPIIPTIPSAANMPAKYQGLRNGPALWAYDNAPDGTFFKDQNGKLRIKPVGTARPPEE